jgi:hypothetical protein
MTHLELANTRKRHDCSCVFDSHQILGFLYPSFPELGIGISRSSILYQVSFSEKNIYIHVKIQSNIKVMLP